MIVLPMKVLKCLAVEKRHKKRFTRWLHEVGQVLDLDPNCEIARDAALDTRNPSVVQEVPNLFRVGHVLWRLTVQRSAAGTARATHDAGAAVPVGWSA